MTAQTLTPEQEAFIALADHCIDCTECRPDPESPEEGLGCPTATTLYRAWWSLFCDRISRARAVRS